MIGWWTVREEALRELAERLVRVDGVVAVVLGGSRARGIHRPDADTDLGLYFQGRPDVGGLRRLAAEVGDEPAEVGEPGRWGPWVDGGAWCDGATGMPRPGTVHSGWPPIGRPVHSGGRPSGPILGVRE